MKRAGFFEGLKNIWRDNKAARNRRSATERLRKRLLRVEALESRELLSLTIGNYTLADCSRDMDGAGWAYDGASKTLELTSNYSEGRIVADGFGADGLTIEIHDNVTIAAGNLAKDSQAIQTTDGSNLKIRGFEDNAELRLVVYSINTQANAAIDAGGTLTVEGLKTLDIDARENDGVDGIRAAGDVNFSACATVRVRVASGRDALYMSGEAADSDLTISTTNANLATRDAYSFLGGVYHMGATTFIDASDAQNPISSTTAQTVALTVTEDARTVDYVAADAASLKAAVEASAGLNVAKNILITSDITLSERLAVGYKSGVLTPNTSVVFLSDGPRVVERNFNLGSLITVGDNSLDGVSPTIHLSLGTAKGMGSATLALDGGAQWADVPLEGADATLYTNVADRVYTIAVGSTYTYDGVKKIATKTFVVNGTETLAIKKTTVGEGAAAKDYYRTLEYSFSDAYGADGIGTYVVEVDMADGLGDDYLLPYYTYVDAVSGTLTVVGRKNVGVSSHSSVLYDAGVVDMYSGVSVQNGQNTQTSKNENSAGGVSVYGNKAVYGVSSKLAAEFNFYGGTVRYNEGMSGGGFNVRGKLNLEGGEIFGNASKSYVPNENKSENANTAEGAGVRNEYGYVEINDGAIAENCCYGIYQFETYTKENSTDAKGGGFHNSASATTVMNGGVIENNYCTSQGGGFYAGGTGTAAFTMNGGEISGNVANQGGGIYMNSEIGLYGGTIVDNRVTGGADRSIGVLQPRVAGSSDVFYKFHVSLNYNTIVAEPGNSVEPNGHGIFVRSRNNNLTKNFPTMKLGGGIQIDSNNDVYLFSNQNYNQTSNGYYVPIQVVSPLTAEGVVALVDVNETLFKTNSETGKKGGTGLTVGYRDFVKFDAGLTLQPEKFATTSSVLTTVPNAVGWGDGSNTSTNNVAFNVLGKTGSPEVNYMRIYATDNDSGEVVNSTNYLVQRGNAVALYADYLAELGYEHIYVAAIRNTGVTDQISFGNFTEKQCNVYLFAESAETRVNRTKTVGDETSDQDQTLLYSASDLSASGYTRVGAADSLAANLWAKETSYVYLSAGDYTFTIRENFDCEAEVRAAVWVHSNVSFTCGDAYGSLFFDGDYTTPTPCPMFVSYGNLTFTGKTTIQNMTNGAPENSAFVANAGAIVVYGSERVFRPATDNAAFRGDGSVYLAENDCELTVESTSVDADDCFVTTVTFTEKNGAKSTFDTRVKHDKLLATNVITTDGESEYLFYSTLARDANGNRIVQTEIVKKTGDYNGCYAFKLTVDPTASRSEIREGFVNYRINNSKLTIEGDVKIENCVGADAGGVVVVDGAVFDMKNNASIINCTGGVASVWGDAPQTLLGAGGVRVYQTVPYAAVLNLKYNDGTASDENDRYVFTADAQTLSTSSYDMYKKDNFNVMAYKDAADRLKVLVTETKVVNDVKVTYASTITLHSDGRVTSDMNQDSTVEVITAEWTSEGATISFLVENGNAETNATKPYIQFNLVGTNMGTSLESTTASSVYLNSPPTTLSPAPNNIFVADNFKMWTSSTSKSLMVEELVDGVVCGSAFNVNLSTNGVEWHENVNSKIDGNSATWTPDSPGSDSGTLKFQATNADGNLVEFRLPVVNWAIVEGGAFEYDVKHDLDAATPYVFEADGVRISTNNLVDGQTSFIVEDADGVSAITVVDGGETTSGTKTATRADGVATLNFTDANGKPVVLSQAFVPSSSNVYTADNFVIRTYKSFPGQASVLILETIEGVEYATSIAVDSNGSTSFSSTNAQTATTLKSDSVAGAWENGVATLTFEGVNNNGVDVKFQFVIQNAGTDEAFSTFVYAATESTFAPRPSNKYAVDNFVFSSNNLEGQDQTTFVVEEEVVVDGASVLAVSSYCVNADGSIARQTVDSNSTLPSSPQASSDAATLTLDLNAQNDKTVSVEISLAVSNAGTVPAVETFEYLEKQSRTVTSAGAIATDTMIIFVNNDVPGQTTFVVKELAGYSSFDVDASGAIVTHRRALNSSITKPTAVWNNETAVFSFAVGEKLFSFVVEKAGTSDATLSGRRVDLANTESTDLDSTLFSAFEVYDFSVRLTEGEQGKTTFVVYEEIRDSVYTNEDVDVYTSMFTVDANGGCESATTSSNISAVNWDPTTKKFTFTGKIDLDRSVNFEFTLDTIGGTTASGTVALETQNHNVSTVNISGGEIVGCSGMYGGAIWNEGVVMMTGGSIFGNDAELLVVNNDETISVFSDGNGVYQNGVFNISGTAYIGNPSEFSVDETNGVYLDAGHIVCVDAVWSGNSADDPLYVASKTTDDGTVLVVVDYYDDSKPTIYNSTDKKAAITDAQSLIREQKIVHLNNLGIIEGTEDATSSVYDVISVTRSVPEIGTDWDYTQSYRKYLNALVIGKANVVYGNTASNTLDFQINEKKYCGGDAAPISAFVDTNLHERENAEFVGWNTKSDGSGVWYYPGSNITIYAGGTLYAQWRDDVGLVLRTQDDEFDLTWDNSTKLWSAVNNAYLSLREAIVLANQRSVQGKIEDSTSHYYSTIVFSANEWEWEHVHVQSREISDPTTVSELYDETKAYATTSSRLQSYDHENMTKTIVSTTVSYGNLRQNDDREWLIDQTTSVETYVLDEWIFEEDSDYLNLALVASLPTITAPIAISGLSFSDVSAVGRTIRIDGATTDDGDYYAYDDPSNPTMATRSKKTTTARNVRILTANVDDGYYVASLSLNEKNAYSKVGVDASFSFGKFVNVNDRQVVRLQYEGQNGVNVQFDVDSTGTDVPSGQTTSDGGVVSSLTFADADADGWRQVNSSDAVETFSFKIDDGNVLFRVATTDLEGNAVVFNATCEPNGADVVTATVNYEWTNSLLLEGLSFVNGGGTHDVDERINAERAQETALNSGHGGALMIVAGNVVNVAVVDSFFENCSAVNNGAVGGAIANRASLSLLNVDFTKNGGDATTGDGERPTGATATTKYGGAVYNSGTLVVSSSEFELNVAEDAGGAIYNSGALTIDNNSTIFRNASNGDGGGIYNFNKKTADQPQTNSLSIKNSAISSNVAFGRHTQEDGKTDGFGGGLMNCAGLDVALNNVALIGNLASRNGGGLCNAVSGTLADGNEIRGDVELTACQVTGNFAQYGGGILNGGVLRVYGSMFGANQADVNGGGISNTDHTEAETAVDAVATVNVNTGAELYVDNLQFGALTATVFTENRAEKSGGGISNWGKICEINGSTRFEHNDASSGKQFSTVVYSKLSVAEKVEGVDLTDGTVPKFTWVGAENVNWKIETSSNSAICLASVFDVAEKLTFSRAIVELDDGSAFEFQPDEYWTPSALGLTGSGLYNLTLFAGDASGAFGVEFGLALTVSYESPTISVRESGSEDGSAYVLNLETSRSNGVATRQWIIDWGDGSAYTTVDALGNALTAAHFYAPTADAQTYCVRLQTIDSNGEGADDWNDVALRRVDAFATSAAVLDVVGDAFGPEAPVAALISLENAARRTAPRRTSVERWSAVATTIRDAKAFEPDALADVFAETDDATLDSLAVAEVGGYSEKSDRLNIELDSELDAFFNGLSFE